MREYISTHRSELEEYISPCVVRNSGGSGGKNGVIETAVLEGPRLRAGRGLTESNYSRPWP